MALEPPEQNAAGECTAGRSLTLGCGAAISRFDPSRSLGTAKFAVMHNTAQTAMMCSVEPGQANETALQSRPRTS